MITPNERIQAVLELLEGNVSAADLALRHQVEERELLAWRDTWLAGARASSRPRSHRGLLALAGVLVVAGLGFASKAALAASCATPSFFSNLGLRYFCADDPALASEVNQNTQQLVGLIQQKLGSSWGSADAGVSTSGISTSSAIISGPSFLTGGATVGSTSNISFGSQVRQMINLFGTQYGIGVQNSTTYFRSGANFAWYVNGVHADGAFDPGGGVEAMRLTSSGALSVRGLKQVDGAAPTVSPLELQRLIVEATPASVGIVVPIDNAALSAICRDDDGCSYTISMVNWDGTGNITSRAGHFFWSTTTNAWRLENDAAGTDANNVLEETSAWDCYFGDSNFATDTNNGRIDNGGGFGLLNCKNCLYSDTTTTCRMVFRD